MQAANDVRPRRYRSCSSIRRSRHSQHGPLRGVREPESQFNPSDFSSPLPVLGFWSVQFHQFYLLLLASGRCVPSLDCSAALTRWPLHFLVAEICENQQSALRSRRRRNEPSTMPYDSIRQLTPQKWKDEVHSGSLSVVIIVLLMHPAT